MEHLALFLHLVGALLLVSGMAVAGAASETARRRSACGEIALLLGLSRIGVALVGTGSLLVVGAGLWLVDLGGFDLDSGWLVAAIALLVASFALGAIGGQRPKQARRLATRLAAAGEQTSAELRGLLDDRASRAANYGSALLILVILVLMVWKPGSGGG